MKLRAEVTGIKSLGNEVAVTVENVDRVAGGRLSDMGPPFTFRVPFTNAKTYRVGRVVVIEVTPQ